MVLPTRHTIRRNAMRSKAGREGTCKYHSNGALSNRLNSALNHIQLMTLSRSLAQSQSLLQVLSQLQVQAHLQIIPPEIIPLEIIPPEIIQLEEIIPPDITPPAAARLIQHHQGLVIQILAKYHPQSFGNCD